MTTDIYLFPHQDDEYGAFEAMRRSLRAGNGIAAFFLTDGAYYGGPELTKKRDVESRRVLERLGVPAEDIHFLGTEAQITDGRLVHQLPRVFQEVTTRLAGKSGPFRVFGPAWEGGNMDHDAAHLLARRLYREFGRNGELLCFPIYNSAGLPMPLFRVLSALPANGPVTRLPIAWRDRLWDLGACLSYPSQWKFWLGLFPPVLAHYLLRGWQSLQRPDVSKPVTAPHGGKLRYERWFDQGMAEFLAVAGPEFTGPATPE